MISDPQIICEKAADHFHKLFTATPYVIHEELFACYPNAIQANTNASLCEIPSCEEIWEVIRGLSPDSAPGIDGFSGHFFKGCSE